MDALLQRMEQELSRRQRCVRLLLPYEQGGWLDILHSQAQVRKVDYEAGGIAVEAVCGETLAGRLRPYLRED